MATCELMLMLMCTMIVYCVCGPEKLMTSLPFYLPQTLMRRQALRRPQVEIKLQRRRYGISWWLWVEGGLLAWLWLSKAFELFMRASIFCQCFWSSPSFNACRIHWWRCGLDLVHFERVSTPSPLTPYIVLIFFWYEPTKVSYFSFHCSIVNACQSFWWRCGIVRVVEIQSWGQKTLEHTT